MRILPSDEHQIRKEKVLQAVIHIFIKNGKPVGSTTILEDFEMNLSAATIRNVLAELEKEGYLTHPHTSAGRVPTDKGYRFYVNSIVNIQRLAEEERNRIQSEYAKRMQEIDHLVQSTTKILSSLSHCTGFVLRSPLTDERLSRVELIPVNEQQILGVLVSESGHVKNQMIRLEQSPGEKSLRFASQFLTDQLKGLSFTDANNKLASELEQYHVEQLNQKGFLESLGQNLFQLSDRNDLFMEGASNLLNFPEFHDLQSMRNFARLVDKKEALADIINKELNRKGIQVRIGDETTPELKDFSVVSSSYQVRGRPLGVLGILGPKRMPYERMIAIVNTVAELVNRSIEKNEQNLLEE